MANSSPPTRADQPAAADRPPQRLGHRPQGLIAGQVPAAVVELLEVVDVEPEQPAGLGLWWKWAKLPEQFVIERAAVGQMGERVGPRGGKVCFDLGGLMGEPLLGGRQALLKLLVEAQQPGDRPHDRLGGGRARLGRGEDPAGLAEPRLVPADLLGHGGDHLPEPLGQGVQRFGGGRGRRGAGPTVRQQSPDHGPTATCTTPRTSTVRKISQENAMQPSS